MSKSPRPLRVIEVITIAVILGLAIAIFLPRCQPASTSDRPTAASPLNR